MARSTDKYNVFGMWLTVKEAAEMCHVSTNAIYAWKASGRTLQEYFESHGYGYNAVKEMYERINTTLTDDELIEKAAEKKAEDQREPMDINQAMWAAHDEMAKEQAKDSPEEEVDKAVSAITEILQNIPSVVEVTVQPDKATIEPITVNTGSEEQRLLVWLNKAVSALEAIKADIPKNADTAIKRAVENLRFDLTKERYTLFKDRIDWYRIAEDMR